MKTKSLLAIAVSAVVSTYAVADVKTYNLVGEISPTNNYSNFPAGSSVEMKLTYDREALTNAIIPGGVLYHVDITPMNYAIEISISSPGAAPVVFVTDAVPGMPPSQVTMEGSIYPYYWSEEVRDIPMFTDDPTGNPMPMVVNASVFFHNQATQTPAGVEMFDTSTLRLLDLETLNLDVADPTTGIPEDQVDVMFGGIFGSFAIDISSLSVEGGDGTSAELTLVCSKLDEVCGLVPYACDVTSTNAFDVLSNVCGTSQQ